MLFCQFMTGVSGHNCTLYTHRIRFVPSKHLKTFRVPPHLSTWQPPTFIFGCLNRCSMPQIPGCGVTTWLAMMHHKSVATVSHVFFLTIHIGFNQALLAASKLLKIPRSNITHPIYLLVKKPSVWGFGGRNALGRSPLIKQRWTPARIQGGTMPYVVDAQ